MKAKIRTEFNSHPQMVATESKVDSNQARNGRALITDREASVLLPIGSRPKSWIDCVGSAGKLFVILLAVILAAGCSGDDSTESELGLEGLPFGFDGIEAPSLDELVPGRLGPRPEGSIKTVVEHYLQTVSARR